MYHGGIPRVVWEGGVYPGWYGWKVYPGVYTTYVHPGSTPVYTHPMHPGYTASMTVTAVHGPSMHSVYGEGALGSRGEKGLGEASLRVLKS